MQHTYTPAPQLRAAQALLTLINDTHRHGLPPITWVLPGGAGLVGRCHTQEEWAAWVAHLRAAPQPETRRGARRYLDADVTAHGVHVALVADLPADAAAPAAETAPAPSSP